MKGCGKSKLLIIRILFILFSPILIKAQVEDYYMKVGSLQKNGNYLGLQNYIKEQYNITNDHDGLVMSQTYLGNHKKALELFLENKEYAEHGLKSVEKFNSIPSSKYIAVTLDSMFAKFKETDIILINEAHHKANHRVFLMDNLENLYNLGYRYLFIEALMEKQIKNYTPPTYNMLTYTEPCFGNLARKAMEIGFQLFSYDEGWQDKEYSWQIREDAMANNILNTIKDLKPAKSIVYGGYSHIATNTKDERLGKQLSEKFNVISIDQTNHAEEFSAKYETKFYDSISAKINSSVFFQNNPNHSEFDYTLIHPRTKYINDKPIWYIKDKKKGYIKTTNIKNINTLSEILVQVYKKNDYDKEGDRSLPIYQFVEKNIRKKIIFYFGNSNDIIIIRDNKGKIIYKSKAINFN